MAEPGNSAGPPVSGTVEVLGVNLAPWLFLFVTRGVSSAWDVWGLGAPGVTGFAEPLVLEPAGGGVIVGEVLAMNVVVILQMALHVQDFPVEC